MNKKVLLMMICLMVLVSSCNLPTECEKRGDREKINIKSFSRKNNISDNALKKAMNDVEEFF